MPISTFGEMKERLIRDLEPHVGRLTGDEVGIAITDAIERMTDEPFWWLDYVRSATMTASQSSDAMPSDLVSIDEITVLVGGDNYPLDEIPYDEYRWLQTSETDLVGQPNAYSLFQNKFWWYPTPDQGYTYSIYYQRRLTELSDDTDTNEWITYAWQMVRWEALSELGVSPLDLTSEMCLRWRGLAEREKTRLLRKSIGRTMLSHSCPRAF